MTTHDLKKIEDTKVTTLKNLLESQKKQIALALPKHVTVERMMRIAMTEARKNPQLLDCDQASFMGAIIQCSQLGLEPGGALGHAYLVPFFNKKKGYKEVQMIPGYRGFIDLALRSGKVAKVDARAVHEGDVFEYEFGLHEDIIHKPCKSPGKLTHVYCVFQMMNGAKSFDVMTVDDINGVKSRSQSANNGPWVTDFDAMAKKSVIRRHFKLCPASIELQKAVGLDEQDERGDSQNNDIFFDAIETTGTHIPETTKEQIEEVFGNTHKAVFKGPQTAREKMAAQAIKPRAPLQPQGAPPAPQAEPQEEFSEKLSSEFEAALAATPDPRDSIK